MENTFKKYRMLCLTLFSAMYSFVYLGRFNVNNLMSYISEDMSISIQHQDLISISVFITYAVGSFVNGYIADKYGAKKIVVIGGIMTCALNISIALQDHWYTVLITCILNGYFQSMIWVGGISILSHWWREGERGKGVGIVNFFSGMSHTVAYLVPIMMASLWPALGWRWYCVIPIGILMIFVVIFAIFAVEKPEDIGLKPYEGKTLRRKTREEYLTEMAAQGKRPWTYFFSQPKFIWWCFIAMLSSMCRYGLLDWIPHYYETVSDGIPLLSTFSNIMLPIGMSFGTLIITWMAGTKMFENKGIIVIAMAAICGTLVVVFPMVENVQTTLVGIFFTGFVLYGINGILWIHAIDQGCRVFPGSAAGIFNGFAYIGACIENFVFPTVMKLFGNYLSIFISMEVLCVFMVICGIVVSKKDTMIVPEVRE